MAKSHKIKLSIPTPCNEDWDKMTTDEKGRFCASCQKTVVDFSNFTDKELLAYITKAKDKVCGRFNIQQLDRNIVAYQPSDSPIFRRLLLAGTMAAGIAATGYGQSHVPHTTTMQTPPADTNKKPNENQGVVMDTIQITSTRPQVLVMGATESFVIDTAYDIPGNVTNLRTGESLQNVQIIIKKNGTPIDSAVTDINGNFRLGIEPSSMGKKLNVSITYSGYKKYRKSIVFDTNQIQPLYIKMKEN